MITLKTITLKNFLSIGAVTQAVDFDRKDLTLILGENLDLGGDGARNGTGKTSLIQALSYALFGTPINNIRKDNLVNRTNGKGMLVTLDFNVNGTEYKIVRGRKPNVLKFYIDSAEQVIKDDAQGDSRETQTAIESVLNMSSDMFKHIVALNTYSEPFLGLKSNDQRNIIEQLLGITLLSEKAEKIKELLRASKDQIQQEEYRVKAVQEANTRIIEQIESLKRRQKLWVQKKQEDDTKLMSQWYQLQQLDIAAELKAHKDFAAHNQLVKDRTDVQRLLARAELDLDKETKQVSKLKKEIELLKKHECYACGQSMHDDKHEQVLAAKEKALQEAALQCITTSGEVETLMQAFSLLGVSGPVPLCFYDTEQQAFDHASKMDSLSAQIKTRAADTDPYSEQITDMEQTALQEIKFDTINALTKTMEHQKFLLDLLTSKDSFVRKKIIEQNLSYLNARLTHYLDKIGLPHQVIFLNDLTVEITELGREMDFYNLSRGEMNRVILALSWAFRDVWESLYTPINVLFIDELLDNGTDSSGVENSLVVLKDMCRTRQKSVWLISHKEDLISRVSSVLKVIKENGFSSYDTSTEMV
ncbi:MAG: AAA family ATPase [Candidatus Nanopelagicus sp.]